MGFSPKGNKTETIVPVNPEIVTKIKKILSNLNSITVDGRSSYSTTFARLDSSKHHEVTAEVEALTDVFEQIATTLGANQKINHEFLTVMNWELIGEALYFYLDRSDHTRDMRRVTDIFETIFYSLDSSALTAPTNSVYNGQKLTEFLYEFIQLTVVNNQDRFEEGYQQKVTSRYAKIVANSKELQAQPERRRPLYSVTAEDVAYIREIIQDEFNNKSISGAIKCIEKADTSKPEKIQEARVTIDNFFNQFKNLQQLLIQKSETHTTEIGLDIFSIADWKLIEDTLDQYFTYLQQTEQLDFETKRNKYHQALELFDDIFYAMTEEGNNIQVDWLVEEYSLKLTVYGLLNLIVDDDLTEYRPEPVVVDKINKRYQEIVAKDKEAKQRIQEKELADLSV